MKDAARNTDEIRDLLEECVAEANAQAAEEHQKAGFEDHEFTAPELNYVTDELGYKPTREEWKEAGLGWVGGAHCADA